MAKFFGNLHLVLVAGLVFAIAVMLHFGAAVAVDTNSVFRWLHVFFGILWIGLLYYLNFVQVPTMPAIPAEQKGAITGLAYVLAPRRIIHSWVEVWFERRWVCLEGFILDAQYLSSLQRRFPVARRFCGFGAATRDLSAPNIEWRGQDTFIQKEGIVDDFGIFDDPDAFYARHGTNLSGPKRWLFVHAIRRWMNDNVARVRAGRW